MKQSLVVAALTLTLTSAIVSSPANARSSSTTNQLNSPLAKVIQQSSPAVVSIRVIKKDSSSDAGSRADKSSISLGSGAIISAKRGYIVTNAHVVANGKLIIVRLKNSRRYVAKLIGIDRGFDIAVLKINATGLEQLNFADSDKLRVGDSVTAIGSPFGLDQTVTSGVVSALNVNTPKIEGFQSFIQTDASINPGNSGGPLLNMQGKIVGINTAILGPGMNIGIGFAIPSDMAKTVIIQLIRYGKVERGMLGVIAQNLTPELASALKIDNDNGAIVAEVIPGSPASKAGLQPQDIIESINDRAITSSIQLRNTLGVMRPGTKLKIKIKRQQSNMTLYAIVGGAQVAVKTKALPFLAGLQLQDFKELESNGDITQGALVAGIQPTSQAALAGLQPGDIITSAQNTPIKTTGELVKLARQAKDHLLIKINRNNINAFLVIEKQNG